MQTDYVELCYSKKKDEKTSNNEIIVLLQSTCLNRIFILLVLLQIGPRSKTTECEKDERKRKHDTGLVMHQPLARYRGRREINFNDHKSPQSPAAAMNYATHQEKMLVVQQHPS